MKWATCTPVSFKGDDTFWCRDSGLICKGFQRAGYECKAIMPEPWHENDHKEDLIRVPYAFLEDSEWWKSLGITYLVLYSWAHPKYWKVADAAKKAGIEVFVNIDAGALINVKLFFREILKHRFVFICQIEAWREWIKKIDVELLNSQEEKEGVTNSIEGIHLGRLGQIQEFARCFIRFLTDGWRLEKRRRKHLLAAKCIGVLHSASFDSWQRWCENYAPNLKNYFKVINHPVEVKIIGNSLPAIVRKDVVMVVGRWGDYLSKRTQLMAMVAEKFLEKRTDYEFWIVGRYPKVLAKWHEELPKFLKERIKLMGFIPNSEVQALYQQVKISFCSSLSEGSHIASEEALCNGASIVGADSITLACLRDYVKFGHGSLAKENSVDGLTNALLEEANAWDLGLRNSQEIAQHWRAELSVDAVVGKICKALNVPD